VDVCAFVGFLMHLLDVDVMEGVSVELIVDDVDKGQSKVQNNQSFALRSCELIVHYFDLQIMSCKISKTIVQ